MSPPSTFQPLAAAVVHRSELLVQVPRIAHGLTHRVVGLGKAHGNVGYGSPRDKADAWTMRQHWAASAGIEPSTLVTMGQVHGNEVIRVRAADAGSGATPDSKHVGFADALISDAPNVALMTLHADCLSILLVDPLGPAIAAVHAGWRGTVADVAGSAVRAMVAEFRTDPAELLAYLGPAIGGCCNEVGDEVIDAWRAQASDLEELAERAVLHPGPKDHFDVPAANSLLLQRAGLKLDQIEVSAICTKCQKDDWFSHRGHGASAGREGAMIAIVSDQDARQ